MISWWKVKSFVIGNKNGVPAPVLSMREIVGEGLLIATVQYQPALEAQVLANC